MFLEPVAVGDKLPKMPLFLNHETYIPIPLEETYRSAWEAVPAIWKRHWLPPSRHGNGHSKARRRRHVEIAAGRILRQRPLQASRIALHNPRRFSKLLVENAPRSSAGPRRQAERSRSNRRV